MNTEKFRAVVLAVPGMVEGRHMGHADFRLNDRVVASLTSDEEFGHLWLSPEQQAAIVAEFPGQFEPLNGAWGARGWTRVVLRAAKAGPVRGAVKQVVEYASGKPASVKKAKR